MADLGTFTTWGLAAADAGVAGATLATSDTITIGSVVYTYDATDTKWVGASSGGGSTFSSTVPTEITTTNDAAGKVLVAGTGNGQYFHAQVTSNSSAGTTSQPSEPALTNTSGNSYFVKTGQSYGAQVGLNGFSFFQGFVAAGDAFTGRVDIATGDAWVINSWDA